MKLTIVAGGLLAALSFSKVALALSCLPCPSVFPPRVNGLDSNQTMDVPSNFTFRRFAGFNALEFPSDVGLSCTVLPDLADGTESCTLTSSQAFTLDVWGQSWTFNVSSDPDNEAPGPVEIVSSGWFSGDSEWNPDGGGVRLSVRPSEDAAGLSLEVEVEMARGTEIFAVPGQPSSSGIVSLSVGQALCHCGANYDPDDVDGASIRVRAVDLAGNRGPWSEAIVAENDSFLGCTCFGAGAGGPAGGLFGLASLGMLVFLRRRRA